MYSHERRVDPSLSHMDPGQAGCVMQLLMPDDTLLVQEIRDAPNGFWNRKYGLDIGQWSNMSTKNTRMRSPRALSPRLFFENVESGFQLGTRWHQGRLVCPQSHESVSWSFSVEPLSFWGRRGTERPRDTASWLGRLPGFDTGYQVLMSQARVSGYVQHGEHSRLEFENAIGYAEKNWGLTFPSKWFWLQCSHFENEPDASFTAVGAVRSIAGGIAETIGMIALTFRGEFYEFANWSVDERGMQWDVAPWGSWKMRASSKSHSIELCADCDSAAGTRVLGPTRSGMKYTVRDASSGRLRLTLLSHASGERLELQSNLCAVEIGGAPWDDKWDASMRPLPQGISTLIRAFNGV
ncbi:putative tocopherol cyclase, chloroplastic [Porphyridium purpureum]|uniref:Putative tocopherol cyclase, chloroplastic n=1 Tax=Porphyridium purpureum TaxID=35688 RepID=A0A5J4Z4F6_PORPP|nr:putative tocopherol cyclase, chloroplastic [Porphyridium purpureum]|eukprot:POR2206..scf295_1